MVCQTDAALDQKVNQLIAEFSEFMNDDFNSAKVIANIFELVPIINSIKDKHIQVAALSSKTLALMQTELKVFIESIFGLINERPSDEGQLDGVLQLLMDIRKDAKSRKDFLTSDKIRNELAGLGIQLKDEKEGGTSYTIV
jgi:cysteinyl-tRNA synthetase